MQLIKRPPLPQTEESAAQTIPANLPSVVRSVAESLILRDPDSARRYLALYKRRGIKRLAMTRIHLLTITPMGILIVYRDRLWQFRVLSGGSIYGQAKQYYSAEAAEAAGREWVGSGW